MHCKFIITFFFVSTALGNSDKLSQLSSRLTCEGLSTAAACGNVGQMRKWNFARTMISSSRKFNASSTFDGVFKALNLPDTPESDTKVKEFLAKAEEIINSNRTELEKAYIEKQTLEQKAKSATSNSEMAAANQKIVKVSSSLYSRLKELELKQFGKINLANSRSPAEVFNQYANEDFNFSAAKKGWNTPVQPVQESYIKSQRQKYSHIMKSARQAGFTLRSLGGAIGGSALAIASAATSAANISFSTALIVNCAKELDVKLSEEDIFQLSRYAYSNKGMQTENKNCESIQFNPGSIETLTVAKMMTPEMKVFFEKFHDIVQKRQDQIFDLPHLEFSCNKISWDSVDVEIEDSKLIVRSKLEGKKLNTEISWNSVDEWDYMTITSDNPEYKDYLVTQVRSLIPTSSTGRSAQRLQMSVPQSCKKGSVGFHDQARCDTAKAIALWNQFSVEHKQGCKKTESQTSKSSQTNDYSKTTEVKSKR